MQSVDLIQAGVCAGAASSYHYYRYRTTEGMCQEAMLTAGANLSSDMLSGYFNLTDKASKSLIAGAVYAIGKQVTSEDQRRINHVNNFLVGSAMHFSVEALSDKLAPRHYNTINTIGSDTIRTTFT